MHKHVYPQDQSTDGEDLWHGHARFRLFSWDGALLVDHAGFVRLELAQEHGVFGLYDMDKHEPVSKLNEFALVPTSECDDRTVKIR